MRQVIKKTAIAIGLIVIVSGCGGTKKPLLVGESVKINYVCTSKRHGLVDTTHSSVANDESVKKSRVFVKYSTYRPLNIIIGQDQPGQSPGDLKLLDPEIRTRIAHAMVGKKPGKSYQFTLESETPADMEDANRYRVVDRIRTVPRYRTISRESFIRGKNREPVMDEVFDKDGHPYAKIVSIDGENLTLKMITDEAQAFETPLGTVTASGDEKKVFVTIHSEVGRLVRTGSVIGIVSEINEKSIIIDYGHPFAGMVLDCHVEALEPDEKLENKTGAKK